MPDVAFLRIRTGKSDVDDLAYTLIRNKAHSNVAFMFDEESRREHDEDTLTVYRGLIGSYPNFMFDVPISEVDGFTEALHQTSSEAEFSALARRYGVPRMHPEIWNRFQWFVDHGRRAAPIDAGVYDLNRYKQVSHLMADEDE
jgi:hypothetical protein